MKFYHGTSEEKWKLIQKEKILWGYNIYKNADGSTYRSYRYTYLTPEIEVAEKYGDVLLEVEYEPVGVDGQRIDNYGFDPPSDQTCWQFSVFIPITINNVKKLNI